MQHFKLLQLFWTTSIAAELEYRLNFAIATLTSLGNLVGGIFGLFLFYRTGYTFDGWSWERALLVMGFFTLLQGISNAFLAPNLNRIVDQVEKGTLDFVLLKPISTQFWLSTRMISPWGLPDVAFGLGVILYAGNRLNLVISDFILGLFPLFFGILILYSLWFLLGTTSVWFVKIYNITEVLRALLDAGRYPVIAYPIAYRVFFTFVVPVAFLTTVPAQALLGEIDMTWFIGSLLLAIALLILSNVFWKFALRYYTSASS
ncbi:MULTISPECIES: ABC transporter permease [unclassified Roseofilum]|uniref:ABC transporter permease n=1 Tax=unclassified Roseofilum TaxID=2620099 RepID=UPI000E882736|nr:MULTISPECIES: ABC-2 family transporter protein [unclassified Roseofilum]HBQ97340.1 ABC transporter permease [Cyanobacteria bacterium UBA11691]MBP0008604.1 ABC-2 family transporter protein [Roseofilum sp. Belize Diploria]MBP0015131.1 ABC-2 family transporter protein [Roseofilum sp. SID3]MBP0023327.1 ABC-2 family transporter protein [Roseofilum sp. SID2]MBP0034546.1 ABC-2 family transporter protein [Roseofilum sp. Belize BBD 4]